jgi:hypothetical protein
MAWLGIGSSSYRREQLGSGVWSQDFQQPADGERGSGVRRDGRTESLHVRSFVPLVQQQPGHPACAFRGYRAQMD